MRWGRGSWGGHFLSSIRALQEQKLALSLAADRAHDAEIRTLLG
jgi:hypothetical protein